MKAKDTWIDAKKEKPTITGYHVSDYVWASYRINWPRVQEWTTGVCQYNSHTDAWRREKDGDIVEVSHWMPLPESPMVNLKLGSTMKEVEMDNSGREE